MENPLLAGLVAAIPLAAVLAVYALVRGRALAAFFQSQGDEIAGVPEKTLLLIILVSAIGISFMFGGLAGLVYSWLGMPLFEYLAFGATLLFSLLAVISRQPLAGDKIAWNLAVGGVLGALVPLLCR